MKTIGYLLIAAGFLAGSLVAVQTKKDDDVDSKEDYVDWNWFLPALAVGGAGVILARMGDRFQSRHEESLNVNVDNLQASLNRIVENTRRLNAEKQELHPYELHKRIDELFPQDLHAFVEARKSIGHVYGLRAYADVMNEFAAGERYLNRVWSASVDCYIDDSHEYLERAQHQFEQARLKLAALRSS